MDKQQVAVVDQALKQLENPALRTSKPARRVERVLTEARKTGKLDTGELRDASIDLVKEFDVPSFFAETDDDGRDTPRNGIGILILLLLLLALLALAEDSDLAALIQDLIDRILAELRGG